MAVSEASTEFGARLEYAIRDRKLTFSKVANKSGISRASLSHYIYGERIPNADAMMRIAKCLYLTPDELYRIMEALYDDLDDYPD